DLEFDAVHPHDPPGDADLVPRGIERDLANRQFFLGPFAFSAAQDPIYPQNQFAWTERLRHVIVPAKFESHDAIDLLRLRPQHDDRDLAGYRIGFQHLADLEPGHAGKHQVENDQGRALFAAQPQAGRALGRDAQSKSASFAQMEREQIDHVRFVLDY